MNYADALAWLDSHINSETGVVVDRAGIPVWSAPSSSPTVAGRRLDPPNLGRMRDLLAYLGDPQLDLDIVHITGTNAKGSVARMVASLLTAAGQSVGMTTSPHLASFHERVVALGEPIGDAALADQLTAVALAEQAAIERGGERASWFEIMIAVAFRWFNDVAVGASVVEVGAPLPTVRWPGNAPHTKPQLSGCAAGIPDDDNVIAGLDGVDRHVLAAELAARSPFDLKTLDLCSRCPL